jgi:Mn-dependent DtxR family transcriptional regulator
MGAKIEHGEWLSAFAELSKRNDKGFTVAEWAERMGKTPKTVLVMLHKAQAMGWLRVGQRTATTLIGRTYQAPVYWVEKPKK